MYVLKSLNASIVFLIFNVVVGGQMRIQLHSGSQLIVNSTVELHTYHFTPSAPTTDILFLPNFHPHDTETAVWNPLADPPMWPSQPDCRNLTHGCPHRMRYGMHTLVLTRDAFILPKTKDSKVVQRDSKHTTKADTNIALNLEGTAVEHKKQLADDALSNDQEADPHIMHWATNLTLSVGLLYQIS